MTGKIITPGVYDMTSEDYHRDPCSGPSLGSSGARELISGCPASFRWKQDNPEIKEAFDIGNATHLLVLEPHLFEAKIGRVPYDDYRKAEAKAARDDIRASGRLPFLPRDLEIIEGMRASLAADPIARFAFLDTEIERSMFWRDPIYNFWGKVRPDAFPRHLHYLCDLKTAISADPDDVAKAIANYGYHQQAQWYASGVEQVLGVMPPKFAFVVVCKAPPHLVMTFWLKPEAIEWGRIQNLKARSIFAWCIKHNRWPGYQPDITKDPAAFEIGLPAWYDRELQRQYESGELDPVAV